MATTSSSRDAVGLVRLGDGVALPLYRASDVPAGFAPECGAGPVGDTACYEEVAIELDQAVADEVGGDVWLRVEGGVLGTDRSGPVTPTGREPMRWRRAGSGAEGRRATYVAERRCATMPFLLTWGYDRIEVVGAESGAGGPAAAVLSTRDVICRLEGRDGEVAADAASDMIDELLGAPERGARASDDDHAAALGWMTLPARVGDRTSERGGASTERQLSAGRSRPLSVALQLIERIVSEYARQLDYFMGSRHRRVASLPDVVPVERLRSLGSRELQWIARHPEQLRQLEGRPERVGVSARGARLLPDTVGTLVKAKTPVTYENQAIVGFLVAIERALAAMSGAPGPDEALASLAGRLRTADPDDVRRCPALFLVQQVGSRSRGVLEARGGELLRRAQLLRRQYAIALEGVEGSYERLPRPTKVFLEVKPYRAIYQLMRQWEGIGGLALGATEAIASVALDMPRLDRLYEYYALLEILSWLHAQGFESDAGAGGAAHVSYSAEATWGEVGVSGRLANLYRLRREDTGAGEGHLTSVRLYYQPILSSEHPENGLALRPLFASREGGDEGVLIPDFLVEVTRGRAGAKGVTRRYVLDAKFRTVSAVSGDTADPRDVSELAQSRLKYLYGLAGESFDDRPRGVWLLCGRPEGGGRGTAAGRRPSDVGGARWSAWARRSQEGSGAEELRVGASCLDHILGDEMGLWRPSED